VVPVFGQESAGAQLTSPTSVSYEHWSVGAQAIGTAKAEVFKFPDKHMGPCLLLRVPVKQVVKVSGIHIGKHTPTNVSVWRLAALLTAMV